MLTYFTYFLFVIMGGALDRAAGTGTQWLPFDGRNIYGSILLAGLGSSLLAFIGDWNVQPLWFGLLMGATWVDYRIPAWFKLKDRGWENGLGTKENIINETLLMSLRMLFIFPVFLLLGFYFGSILTGVILCIITAILMSVLGGLPYWFWTKGDPGKTSEWIAGLTFHSGIVSLLLAST